MRISVKETVYVDHLRENSRQLLRDQISIDRVILEVLEIVDPSSLDN
jgi:hypothetical protein